MKNIRRIAGRAGALLAALLLAASTGCGLRTIEEAQDDGADIRSAETETESGTAELPAAEASAGTVSQASAPAAAVTVSAAGADYLAVTTGYTVYENGAVSTDAAFTERDLTQNADLGGAVLYTAEDNTVIDITAEGVYVLTGNASDCTVRVEAGEEDKVQLVLDGVSIENANFPAILVLSADKVFVTTAKGTENTLTVTGAYRSEGSVNADAVIFSKQDLVLNGMGTLNIISNTGNGITSKDDLKITGGTYNIAAALDALEANDAIAASDGVFNIYSNKDGLHCENDDAEGWIWIGGGSWTITASADGIQGTDAVQIDGGTFSITASEGIEATYVQINGGDISISASDDGINASNKSSVYPVAVEINGGNLNIVTGQGDTDAIDANGSIYINGGTVSITANGMASFDCDGAAEFNGGTILINGEEVDEIPADQMGGPGGFGGGGRGGWGGNPGGWRGNPGGWGGRNP